MAGNLLIITFFSPDCVPAWLPPTPSSPMPAQEGRASMWSLPMKVRSLSQSHDVGIALGLGRSVQWRGFSRGGGGQRKTTNQPLGEAREDFPEEVTPEA